MSVEALAWLLMLTGNCLFCSGLIGDVCRYLHRVYSDGVCAHLGPAAQMSNSPAPEEEGEVPQQAHFPPWRRVQPLLPPNGEIQVYQQQIDK